MNCPSSKCINHLNILHVFMLRLLALVYVDVQNGFLEQKLTIHTTITMMLTVRNYFFLKFHTFTHDSYEEK